MAFKSLFMQNPIALRALSLNQTVLPLFIVVMHFSPPATLIASVLLLMVWLGAGYAKLTPTILRNSGIALAALALFLWLGLSAIYSAAPLAKSFSTLGKYRELLLPLVLLPLLSSRQLRGRSETVLVITLFATLLVSTAGYLHWLPAKLVNDVLKNRITHSLFMAFLGFYSLHQLYAQDKRKWLWGFVLLWVGANLFVMSNGRTGQVVFLGLGALFVFQHYKIRTALILSSVLLAAFVVFLWLSPYASRFWDGFHESVAFFTHSGQLGKTSMGERLHFWTNAISIIEHAPWLGEGVGGFSYAFQEAFPQERILANPHNEFLLITAQLGIPGLIAFLYFLGITLKQSLQCHSIYSHLLQGVWLMLIVSCLFNSSILDHTEGHWFMTVIALFSASMMDYRSLIGEAIGNDKTDEHVL
ncbi:MAG: hypothetical protein RL563_1774 [Pseudomonadota bacterium]